MKPEDLQVYDAYLDHIAGLDIWGAQIERFPINDMALINARLRLTGQHVKDGVVTKLSPERLAAHSKLIMAAQAFRTARAEIAREEQERREAAKQQPPAAEGGAG